MENLIVAHAETYKLHRRMPGHVSYDDLHSAAYEALCRAATHFDAIAHPGVPFKAYAKRRVTGALLDYLRSQDHVPRRVRARLKADPNSATTSDLSPLSLDVELPGAEDLTYADLLVDDADPVNQLIARGDITHLQELVNALPVILRHVIRCSYLERRSMADIAVDLDCTESRVSQLRTKGLMMLRAQLEAEEVVYNALAV